jgi:hypothetical protein
MLGARVNGSAPHPVFFVSVAAKGVSFPLSPLKSTLMRRLTSAHSKGLKCRRLRLKTGKTRCSSASAHSKRFKGIAERGDSVAGGIAELGEGIGVRVRNEFGNRRGWRSINTEEDSIP